MRGWVAVVLVGCASPRWERDVVYVDIRAEMAPPGAVEATGRAVETWAVAMAPHGIRLIVSSPGAITVEWTAAADARWPASIGATVLEWDPVDGTISAAHVMLRLDLPWSAGDPCTAYDVEGGVAHELGHAVGLHHLEDPEATMFGGIWEYDVAKRDLAAADLAALAALY
jgi:hypothetical protein